MDGDTPRGKGSYSRSRAGEFSTCVHTCTCTCDVTSVLNHNIFILCRIVQWMSVGMGSGRDIATLLLFLGEHSSVLLLPSFHLHSHPIATVCMQKNI